LEELIQEEEYGGERGKGGEERWNEKKGEKR
jgi:hypothetical protein